MTVYRFSGPSTSRKRSGTCPGCSKRVTRSRTFEHTVNPFNKRADGVIKTWEEVSRDVNAEADVWTPDFRCSNCKFTDWLTGLSAAALADHARMEGYEEESHRRAGRTRRADLAAERITAYNARLAELADVASGIGGTP